MVKLLKNRLFALFIGAAGCIGAAQAGPYSNLVFFGDSLSDTGNVLSLTTARCTDGGNEACNSGSRPPQFPRPSA